MSGNLPKLYRPDSFEFIYGNDHAVNVVKPILKRPLEKIPSAWLFTGNSGTGKTTMIRIIKDELGCLDANFHEGSPRKIEEVRTIAANARMSSMGGGPKIFMLDEAHRLTPEAQDQLLKITEDTPKNTYFFFATTNPEKLKKALITRCTKIAMKDCSYKDLTALVKDIAQEEGVKVDPKVVKAIVQSSLGSPREALNLLDAVININDHDDALAAIEKTAGSETEGFALCQAFMKSCNWSAIAPILKDILATNDTISIKLMVQGYFNKVLLNKDNLRAAIILEQFNAVEGYDIHPSKITLACYNAVFEINQAEAPNSTGDDVPF